MQNKYGGTMIRMTYSGTIPTSPHYDITTQERNYAELTVADNADEAVILKDLVDAGVLVRNFATSKLSLDDIFVQVYGDENELVGV